jgi:hypothetical protein
MVLIPVPSQSALQIGVFWPTPRLAWEIFTVVSCSVYFALQEDALPVTGLVSVHIDQLHLRPPLFSPFVRQMRRSASKWRTTPVPQGNFARCRKLGALHAIFQRKYVEIVSDAIVEMVRGFFLSVRKSV